MSNTSEPLKKQKSTPFTPLKLSALSGDDLALVAERLALIQGHLAKMPRPVISGACIRDGFLLVAVKIPGHELNIVSGVWEIDGIPVTLVELFK